ncbi:MAG TPA: AMP-binding protein [Lysobacter sp.]|nr:AMP-binding protein [Lysobacter sp.]
MTAAQFCGAASELAAALPKKRCVINGCNDRLNFLLGFAAALIARQVSLLPPSRAAATLQELAAAHGGSYCLTDDADLPAGLPAMMLPPWRGTSNATVPEIPDEQIAITAFTSGTTGRSRPQSRSWGSLVLAAELTNRRLGLPQHSRACILGTVPPQHMYGFETTVMVPLQSGVSVHGARPLLPADVAAALDGMPGERWLATTPVHLRACLAAGIAFPPLAGVLSATMPLPADLAALIEDRWATTVHEIYGCTETGTVALRKPTADDNWRVMDGITLHQKGDATFAHGGHLAEPMQLPDGIALSNPQLFQLLGRPQDMVKVAGKRASLDTLNRELLRVRGVQDGAFFVPEHAATGRQRLAAVVAAPGLTADVILRALRQRLDPAFLPRPLLIVDALPRNATGKLPREALLALTAAAKRESA